MRPGLFFNASRDCDIRRPAHASELSLLLLFQTRSCYKFTVLLGTRGVHRDTFGG